MSIKIAWLTDPRFSSVSAAAALCSGLTITDSKLRALIGEPAGVIQDRLALAEVDNDRFWSNLIGQFQRGRDDRARVESALIAAGCGELAADSIAPTIAGQLADLRIAYTEAYPKLGEQLMLRAGPLKEQWEARGPGLLAMIGRLTHPDLLPSKATVAFVQPSLGGGGGADPALGFAWIEAVLTNPHHDVPEVLRLGWLLGRLGLGRSGASRLVESAVLPKLTTLALLPILIDAGREVEIIQDLDLGRLFDVWNLRRLQNHDTVEILSRWWSQMTEAKTPFPVGLKALARMLDD